MIKMVVTDIDGTILGKSLKLSENVKSCFKKLQENNIKTVLATGRMFVAAKKIIEELEIQAPVICYQGALIKTPDGTVLSRILLPRNLTLKIVKYIKAKGIHINIYTDDKLFVENDNAIIKKYANDRNISYSHVKSFENMNFSGVHKLLAIDEDAEKISLLSDELNERFAQESYITKSAANFCEITDVKAKKGNAVKFLANLWGINKSEILGIGDQYNDTDLLLSTGVKVAMGNSVDALKNIADFVCDTVDNDGFVQAVEKYVLKEQNEY